MKFVGLLLIRAYQLCISPLLPPVCKYSPSCSHYTYQSIERHGFVTGVLLGGKRICRCNPWALGGPDPVPEKIRWSWLGPARKGPVPVVFPDEETCRAHSETHECAGHEPLSKPAVQNSTTALKDQRAVS